jgi:2-isopropylmalate synthase
MYPTYHLILQVCTGKFTETLIITCAHSLSTDIGCSYEALIRVNSQSGKAGISALLEQGLGLRLPRELQLEVYRVIQKEAEVTGAEVSLRTVVRLFRQIYHLGREPQYSGCLVLRSYRVTRSKDGTRCSVDAEIQHGGASRIVRGSGCNAQDALISALSLQLNIPLTLLDSSDHFVTKTRIHQGKLASYVQMYLPVANRTVWGVGVSSEDETARLRAVISAANVVMDDLQIRSNWVNEYRVREDYPRHSAVVV